MRCKRFLLSILLWILSISGCKCYCSSRELEAYTSDSLTYRSYGYSYYSRGRFGGYDKNQVCKVLFKASYEKDIIKLEVVDNDMQEKYRGRCLDKVIVYDGPTDESPILKIFCGTEKPVIESTSDQVLLVFETDSHDTRNYRGFRLEYSSIDKGGFDAYKDSLSSISSGTIIASVIPSVLVYAIIMVVVYKRCKYAQRVRRNLAATGHTPEDLRVAMATMIDQASRGRLNVSRGGPQGLQEGLVDIMDQNASNRANSNREEGGGRGQRGRVRHPAGDLRTHTSGNSSQNISTTIPDSDSAMPFLGYNGTDQSNGYYPQPSNNNITTNNNTAANLNYPGYPPDPTGVYYAGEVDENGMLHPPDGSTPYYHSPGSIPPSVQTPPYINHPLLDVEDDHRSRSSGRRSPHGSGRNSPRHSPVHSQSGYRSRASSAGHRSNHLPHRHASSHQGSHRSLNQLESEGSTLTYYGMLDGNGSGSGDNADVRGNENVSSDPLPMEAPPSYEEAATGKYSPYPHS